MKTLKEKLQDLVDQSETEVIFSHIGPIAKEAIDALTSKDLANSAIYRTLKYRQDDILKLKRDIDLYEEALMAVAASHEFNPTDRRVQIARRVLIESGKVKV